MAKLADALDLGSNGEIHGGSNPSLPTPAHGRHDETRKITMMNVTINNVTEVDKEVEISSSNDELAPHFEDAYKRYQQTALLKGFRKGKAPLSMIKQVYGESIRYTALDRIANDLYREAMQARDIRPIGAPVLTTIDYTPENGLNFKIKYEVLPVFELGRYTGISVEKPVHLITDEELNDELDRIRRSNSTLADAVKVSGPHTLVTVDIQELDGGASPLVGRKTTDAKLYLADTSVFKEIREKLIGADLNARVRMTVEPAGGEQGGKRHLEVFLKQIKDVILPEITDEFVNKITRGKTSGVEGFRNELKESITKYWDDSSRRRTL